MHLTSYFRHQFRVFSTQKLMEGLRCGLAVPSAGLFLKYEFICEEQKPTSFSLGF